MTSPRINPIEWQTLDNDFITDASIENAKRLNDLVKTKADQEQILPDPAAYQSLIQSLADSSD